MKAEEYAMWVSKLEALAPAQKKDLANRLKLQGIKPDANAEIDRYDDWLLDGIAHAMASSGLLSRASQKGLIHTKGYETYRKAAPALYAELERLLPDLSKRQRALLAQVVGHALIGSCKRFDLPLTPGFILRRAPYAVEALELAYPGYASAGLLGLIIGDFGNAK